MIVFDTTFLIDLVNANSGATKIAAEVDAKGEIPALSVISIHEYLLGVYLAYYGKESFEKKMESAERDISKFRIMPLTKHIAHLSAKIQAETIRNGKTIGINDIYIAASALYYEAPLMSRNIKHFKQIQDLDLRSY